jgi:pyridoxal phosphate enzyme (YggS family)
MSIAESSIAENLERLHEQVSAACRLANRPESEVALMAVSKVHPVEVILEAYAAGQRLFGENRVQEFADKSASLGHLTDAEYHLIGPLQSNKSTRAAELFHSIDTVDSLKLAQRLNSAAQALNKTLPILIEVKLSHEESKHGIAPDELPALLNAIAELPNVKAMGLMTVPPWPDDPADGGESARPYFRQLRTLRDEQQKLHSALTQLSIGMSNDFRVAIEEGSTCIRVGTALFGKRIFPPSAA